MMEFRPEGRVGGVCHLMCSSLVCATLTRTNGRVRGNGYVDQIEKQRMEDEERILINDLYGMGESLKEN